MRFADRRLSCKLRACLGGTGINTCMVLQSQSDGEEIVAAPPNSGAPQSVAPHPREEMAYALQTDDSLAS